MLVMHLFYSHNNFYLLVLHCLLVVDILNMLMTVKYDIHRDGGCYCFALLDSEYYEY